MMLVVLVLAVATIVAFFYLILPKLNLRVETGKWIRGILFSGVILYLAYDFYLKGKYAWIAILAAGSVSFFMLLTAKKKEDRQD